MQPSAKTLAHFRSPCRMLPAAALAGAALLLHAESAVAFSGFPTRPPGFPPTRPRPSRPPGFGDFPTAPDDAPPNDGFQTGPTTTIGSESSCEAISKTTNFKESIDAHVSAGACTPPPLLARHRLKAQRFAGPCVAAAVAGDDNIAHAMWRVVQWHLRGTRRAPRR